MVFLPHVTFDITGHLKITNVKIAYIFLMVRDRHVVSSYYEILMASQFVGLSESAHRFDIG